MKEREQRFVQFDSVRLQHHNDVYGNSIPNTYKIMNLTIFRKRASIFSSSWATKMVEPALVAHTTKVRSNIVGSIAIVGNVMMYAAPLSVMRLVITTKSVEYMPFFLSLFSLLNGISWTVYALIRFDPFIVIPNGLGSLLGIAQLILYATFYKSTKRQLAEKKANAEMGSVERKAICGPREEI